jgi:circadian clock protein KaiB
VARRSKAERKARPARHRFKLYVTGQTPRSVRAIANLRRLCGDTLADDCEIVVIDVLEQPHLAEADHVMVTPTLIKELPPPSRRVLGDLTDTEQILWGLQISPPVPTTDGPGEKP